MKVAFVIGTYREQTLRQLEYMTKKGYAIMSPQAKEAGLTDLFVFALDKEAHLVTRSFLRALSKYDALVFSGGETANYVLSKAGFRYIEGLPCAMPMVGTGIVRGGLFNGKLTAIKPGHLGEKDALLVLRSRLERLRGKRE